jgi:hypothetical protein
MMDFFEVYYKVNTDFEVPEKISAGEFLSGYRLVSSIAIEKDGDIDNSLEKIYRNMQGENWSPNGEAREYIQAVGLNHTSMSTGDIVHYQNRDKYYVVAPIGFHEITLTF